MTKILVATVSHKHGTNFYASTTRGGLFKQIHDYVLENWIQENIPFSMSGIYEEDARVYFANVEDEFLEIDTCEVK